MYIEYFQKLLFNRSLFPSKDDDDDDDEDEDSPAAHLEVQFFSVTTFYYIVRIFLILLLNIGTFLYHKCVCNA